MPAGRLSTAPREPVVSATELWREMLAHGLNPGGYDSGLVSELRRRLSLGDGEMSDELRAHAVTAEDFLLRFLEAFAPYAEMVGEAITFLRQHAVNTDAKAVAIQFKGIFGGKRRLDLDHLRRSVEEMRRIEADSSVRFINHDVAWMLLRALDVAAGRSRAGEAVVPAPFTPCHRALHSGPWPERIKRPSLDGIDPVARPTIELVWTILDHLVEQLRASGHQDRDQLRKGVGFAWDTSGANDDRAQLQVLASLASDFWMSSMYEALVDLCVPRPALHTRRPDIAKINQLIAAMPVRRRRAWRVVRVKVLTDILDLPLWKKRHELYAFWVFTAIGRALPAHGFKVHAPDGVLHMGFSAARIADLSTSAGAMYVMNEVRVSLRSPIGLKRKAGAQPDYLVSFSDQRDAKAARLIVECKQYANSDRREFVSALVDYARAFPQAWVVLVNYGPIAPDLLDARTIERTVVDRGVGATGVRDWIGRMDTIAEFRPGGSGTIAHLQSIAERALPPGASSPAAAHSAPVAVCVDVSASMSARIVSADFADEFADAVRGLRPVWLIAADSAIRMCAPFSDAAIQDLKALPMRGNTDLLSVLNQLELSPDHVIVLTDDEGKAQLSSSRWRNCCRDLKALV